MSTNDKETLEFEFKRILLTLFPLYFRYGFTKEVLGKYRVS